MKKKKECMSKGVCGISHFRDYFGMLRKGRKRYKRAHQVRGPSLEQQIVDHVDHLGSREYYIVKERKPRFTPKKRRKKRAARRRAGRRGVGRRMIIDIHLEVLNECQKGGLHSTKEDFFEILVKEFMESEFIKEDFVPKEQIPGLGKKTLFLRKESLRNVFLWLMFLRKRFEFQIRGLGRKTLFVRKDSPKEQVPCSGSVFREEDLVPEEDIIKGKFPREDVPKEGVSDEEVPKEQVPKFRFS
ncbi:SICA antigen, partial [Plasmodium coatneyi]